MLKLPLVGGGEVVIFGKDITVSRCFETNHGGTTEVIRLKDGHHNNGGWKIKLPYDNVIEKILIHLGEL